MVRRQTFSCRAFTLVELLIVISLVAILAAIAIPRFSNSALSAKESALRENLRLIRAAMDRAEADTGLTFAIDKLDDASAPSTGWERAAMNTDWSQKSVPAGTWRGPYLSRIPTNPFTGTNSYSGGVVTSTTVSWTHYSKQNFNKSYIFYPSTQLGSDGKPYRQW